MALNNTKKPVRKTDLNPEKTKNHKRYITIGYGHKAEGEYTYLGSDKLRKGQVVTPDVTNKWTGKTYPTLGIVKATRALSNSKEIDKVTDLATNAILLKTIDKTNQTALPGYYQDWDKDAKAVVELEQESEQKPNSSLRYSGVVFKNEDKWTNEQKARYNLLRRGEAPSDQTARENARMRLGGITARERDERVKQRLMDRRF